MESAKVPRERIKGSWGRSTICKVWAAYIEPSNGDFNLHAQTSKSKPMGNWDPDAGHCPWGSCGDWEGTGGRLVLLTPRWGELRDGRSTRGE